MALKVHRRPKDRGGGGGWDSNKLLKKDEMEIRDDSERVSEAQPLVSVVKAPFLWPVSCDFLKTVLCEGCVIEKNGRK